METIGAEVFLKYLEELLDHFRHTESLSIEGDCGGIWNTIHHTKPNKLRKRSPVITLEFKLFITEVKKLLENKPIEEDPWINPLASYIAPTLLGIPLVEQWPE